MECIEIKEGKVKYQGRDDFKCKYSVVGDKQYYYLNDKELSNNSRIATTKLIEAIDPLHAEHASNVGLLDSYGKEVIPCVNKSIKPLNDDIVLVEPAEPISESVKEANSLKKDPLAATKLVSTPALIKDKINSKMGPNGRYVFNNQFSEATIVDVNGNNLVNNEYYSFIANTPDKIYFSKNTVDSVVGEYSILPPEVQSNITPTTDTNEIDVTSVEVPTEVVENALANETPVESVSEAPVEEVKEEVGFDNTIATPNVNEGFASADVTPVALDENQMVNNVELPTEQSIETPVAAAPVENSVEDEMTPPQIEADNVMEEVTPVENTVEETPVGEVTEEVENTVEEAPVGEVTEEVENTVEEAPVEETVTEEVENTVEETPVEEVAEEVENTVEEAPVEEVTEEVENTVEETPVEEVTEKVENTVEEAPVEEVENINVDDNFENTTLDDMFNEVKDARDVEDDMNEEIFSRSEVKADSISFDDDFDDSYDVNGYDNEKSNQDTTMKEVAKSMAGLIKQNKDLKSTNNDLIVKFEKVNASRKNVVEKAKMLEDKVDVLNAKAQSQDSKIIKFESKVDMLENRVRDQERVIEAQRRELDNLRNQLEGKEELSRLLQDAKVMLEDNNTSYSYSDEDNYYRRVA